MIQNDKLTATQVELYAWYDDRPDGVRCPCGSSVWVDGKFRSPESPLHRHLSKEPHEDADCKTCQLQEDADAPETRFLVDDDRHTVYLVTKSGKHVPICKPDFISPDWVAETLQAAWCKSRRCVCASAGRSHAGDGVPVPCENCGCQTPYGPEQALEDAAMNETERLRGIEQRARDTEDGTIDWSLHIVEDGLREVAHWILTGEHDAIYAVRSGDLR